MKKIFSLLFCAIALHVCACAQVYIYSKEGKAIANKRHLVYMCLNMLKKPKADTVALSICECRVDKLDRRFTNKQYRQHTSGGVINLQALINEDSAVYKELQACFINSDRTMLLKAESFEDEFISDCMDVIRNATEKTLDSNKVSNYCKCQLQMIREKKLSDAQINELINPNSVIAFEMRYRCGDPFGIGEVLRNWSADVSRDIKGPAVDTISVLPLNGMTYVKLKIGNTVLVWLFDSGAADMLINAELESKLREQGIINESNYLGTSEYEVANGAIDTCRRYRINGVQIGGFVVDNVTIAVTDRGKMLLLGKSLLNKFSQWILDNKQNKLILSN